MISDKQRDEKIIEAMVKMENAIMIATFNPEKRKAFGTLVLNNPEISFLFLGALEGQIKLMENILAGIERK